MRKFLVGIALSLAPMIGACGSSSSGPSRPTEDDFVLIGDLSNSEIDDVCNYTVDIEDGPADVDCSDGTTVHVLGFSECVDALSVIDPTLCDATGGDYMDCSEDHELNECDDTSIECQNTFATDCVN